MKPLCRVPLACEFNSHPLGSSLNYFLSDLTDCIVPSPHVPRVMEFVCEKTDLIAINLKDSKAFLACVTDNYLTAFGQSKEEATNVFGVVVKKPLS